MRSSKSRRTTRAPTAVLLVLTFSVCLPIAASHAGVPAAPGERAWVALHNGPGSQSVDEALAVTTSPGGGRVYAAGYSGSSRGALEVLAYRASTGELLWRGHYPFAVGEEIWDVQDIVVSADGSRVVTTVALLGVGRDRMAAVAFEADTGHADWLWTYPKESMATGLAAGAGKIFVSGNAGKSRDQDRVVAAVRAAAGTTAWRRVFHDPDGDARAEGVAYDRGGVFVTGGIETRRGWNVRTDAYEAADGTVRWRDTVHRLSSADVAGASTDGATVVVSGVGWTGTTTDRWGTVAYDSQTGERSSLAVLAPAWNGQVWAMTADPDATTVFFAGVREGPGGEEDDAVASVDVATGGLDWASFYDGGGGDGVIGIVASPTAPQVVAASYVQLGGTYSWRTYALDDATGAERWSDVFRGPLHRQGFPRAITIGPGGSRVYVAGYTATRRSDDLATVAYGA